MFYFKQNDNVIEKYQVEFDKEELLNLKQKIIDDCSFIAHEEYETDDRPKLDDKIIRNFKCVDTGKTQEYFYGTSKIYLYSYDVYIPPYLDTLIDELLNGDSKVIDKILNYDIYDKLILDDQINSLYQEIIKLSPENSKERKFKLYNLEGLLKLKELNKGQQSIEPYYNQLIELISFNLVDSLPISETSKIDSFFQIKIADKLEISNSEDESLLKLLKK